MALLTPALAKRFTADGVCVLPRAVPLDLVSAARQAIEAGAEGCSAEVQALWHGTALAPLFAALLGGETQPVAGAQLALRPPTPDAQLDVYLGGPTPSPSDWNGHMDGVAIHDGPHEDDKDLEAPINTFTCLIGVALNDQLQPDCGNFAVCIGSHASNASFFAQQLAAGGPLGPGGPDWPLEPWHREPGSNAARGEWPDLRARMVPPPTRSMGDAARYFGTPENGGWWPSGTQQLLRAGDAVLVHFLALHGESRHAGDSPREMVFFRVKHMGNTAYLPEQHGVTEEIRHMAAVLSDPWLEWPGLVGVAADSGASRISTAPRL